MILPILPDKGTTDLTKHGFEGVVALWRPMDLLDKARWADEVRRAKVEIFSGEAMYLGLKSQLTGIQGLQIREVVDGVAKDVDFDVSRHLRQLPLAFLYPIWDDIETRTALAEDAVKNSERPSASDNPSGSASLTADPAASDSEKSSDASSLGTSDLLPEFPISTL